MYESGRTMRVKRNVKFCIAIILLVYSVILVKVNLLMRGDDKGAKEGYTEFIEDVDVSLSTRIVPIETVSSRSDILTMHNVSKKTAPPRNLELSHRTLSMKTAQSSQSHRVLSLEQAPSNGENLAQRIISKCKWRPSKKLKFKFPVSSNRNHSLLYCPVCKLASTYWTRFFKFLEVSDKGDLLNSPYAIPIAHAPPTAERLGFNKGRELGGYSGLYRYMFVRDPYSRVLSAYVDKLFAPNPSFWRELGRGIIRNYRAKGKVISQCGSDLKFTEYVKAIIDTHHRHPAKSLDCHDATFISYCHPCETMYNFIGKMETFVADSQFIYFKAGLNKTVDYLTENGNYLADEDALWDTVSSPFVWKTQIKRCISWEEALKRIWRKLQIRGVIGKHEFPLDEIQSETISLGDFIRVIRDTQTLTTYYQRKIQRKEALIEIFSDVAQADMEALRHVYLDDFDLFEYDSRPSYLFNISPSFKRYGYLRTD